MNIASPFLVIRASAGTGKTFQLSNRFLNLLLDGVAPERILATTFTRKAAGEILDRVLIRLAEAAIDEKSCKRLAAELSRKAVTKSQVRKLLAELCSNLHRLRIGTLDSYFLQLAASHSLELGLPAAWTICDELTYDNVRDEAIEKLLERGRMSDLLTLLNLLSKGTTERAVSRMVQDTVTNLFELYRQTESAAWEKIRCPKELPVEEVEQLTQQLAEFPLTDKIYAKCRDKDAVAIQAGDWEKFITDGISGKLLCGETNYNKKPIPSELCRIYQRLLKHAEAKLVRQVAQQTESTWRLLDRFAEQFFALQIEERALRFDDVAYRLAAAGGSPERFSYRLDGAIEHLLLDEFQDTSPVQWRVLRPLAKTLTDCKGTSLFCVGDTKQAIYGWRGGVAEIFDALDGELTGLSHSSLDQSYRSSQPVIDTVNQVFANLTRHSNLDRLEEGVRQWQERFEPHSTNKSDLPGYVRLEFAPAAAESEDQGDRVLQHAAEQIIEHTAAAPQCSVGVLMRTNAGVAHMIYLLRQRKLLASEEGGNPLIDSPAVELILSLLKLVDHPGDRVARFHLATSPLAEALELTDENDGLAAMELARRVRRQLLTDGFGPVVFHWAERLAEHCDERDISRLQQLVELAYEYESPAAVRTSEFRSLVETRRVADPAAANVRVMTIHQAKGLEFDIVVLPELDCLINSQPSSVVCSRPSPTEPPTLVCRYVNEHIRKFFPAELQALFDEETRRNVSESLCTLYVAMTRAVHALHMIVAPPKSNEKSLPKTYAGLLRATLGTGALSGRTVYEHGDSKWQRKLKPAELPTPPASKPQAIEFAPPPAARARRLSRVAPSSLEGGARIPALQLLAAGNAADYGTLAHVWLQNIEWLDKLPTKQKLLEIARPCNAASAASGNVAEFAERFLREIEQPSVGALLKAQHYQGTKGQPFVLPTGTSPAQLELSVIREHPFALREDDRLIYGSIDRIVIARQGGKPIAADVVDFKTDAVEAANSKLLAENAAYYEPQIAAYRRATARLLGLDPSRVSARLVFLAAGTVVPLASK